MDIRVNQNAAAASKCDFKKGTLPECAPLAAAYIPYQEENAKKYDYKEGLNHGTLFPGLDLPFKNMIITSNVVNTELAELMALDFALDELGIYLDTHKNDSESLLLYTTYADMYRAGKEKYEAVYGPLTQIDVNVAKGYTWINNPWPWELSERAGD